MEDFQSDDKINFAVKQWFATWFNYPTNYKDVISELFPEYVYICWCEDTCPTTGRPHIHIFIKFRKNRRLVASKIQEKLVDCHWGHVSKPEGCINYIKGLSSKDPHPELKVNFCEVGEFISLGQGHRSDLDVITQKIIDGSSIKDVAKAHPSQFVRYGNRFRDLQRTLLPARNCSCEIHVHELKRDQNFYKVAGGYPCSSKYIYGSGMPYLQQDEVLVDITAFVPDFVEKAASSIEFMFEGTEFNSKRIQCYSDNILEGHVLRLTKMLQS